MEHIQFSKEELERYSRHLIIPEFNIDGQRKLKGAGVLVIGSGGLGSPLLLYLAAAGVGRIGIVDFDTVDASNLQRQVLFGIQSVGQPKVEAAKDRLASLNPHIKLEVTAGVVAQQGEDKNAEPEEWEEDCCTADR